MPTFNFLMRQVCIQKSYKKFQNLNRQEEMKNKNLKNVNTYVRYIKH